MKSTVGILVTTAVDRSMVGFTGTRVLMTLVLGEIGVEEVKFNDTTSGTCVLDICVLTCRGDTPSTNIAKLGVYISPYPSPELDIMTFGGILNLG